MQDAWAIDTQLFFEMPLLACYPPSRLITHLTAPSFSPLPNLTNPTFTSGFGPQFGFWSTDDRRIKSTLSHKYGAWHNSTWHNIIHSTSTHFAKLCRITSHHTLMYRTALLNIIRSISSSTFKATSILIPIHIPVPPISFLACCRIGVRRDLAAAESRRETSCLSTMTNKSEARPHSQCHRMLFVVNKLRESPLHGYQYCQCRGVTTSINLAPLPLSPAMMCHTALH